MICRSRIPFCWYRRWELPLLLACMGGGSGCQAEPPRPISPAATPVATPVSTPTTPPTVTASMTTSPADEAPELAAIATIREEIDLFAETTLQIQRVKLLQESAIQRELKLTADHNRQFAAVQKEVDEIATAIQRLKPAERGSKLRNEYCLQTEKLSALVDGALTEEQRRRLFEHAVARQRGAIVLLLPGVPEHLELTPAQRAKLYQIVDVTRNSVNFDNLYNPLELAKLVRRSNAARQEAEALLTPEQKSRFQALLQK